jgi:hypothetical protein
MTPDEKEKVLGALGNPKWVFRCYNCGFVQEFEGGLGMNDQDYRKWGLTTYNCWCKDKTKKSLEKEVFTDSEVDWMSTAAKWGKLKKLKNP